MDIILETGAARQVPVSFVVRRRWKMQIRGRDRVRVRTVAIAVACALGLLLLALLQGVWANGPQRISQPSQADRASGNGGLWYFKAGDWIDYAPNGVPDFDQRQDGWFTMDPAGMQLWTYCGPVAAANSLWWFDSKFETEPLTPSETVVNDNYPLVETHGGYDDHWTSNVVPLVDELAAYFGTSPITGTNVYSMYHGIQNYLYDHGLYDDYLVTLAPAPTPEWVMEEVLRSEDVILLLGFYQEDTVMGWRRLGGHYVTVAGVDQATMSFAFSDPILDNAEAGQPGRVLSGTLLSHYPPHPALDPTVHNDAGNISHDYYPMLLTSSPGGMWGPGTYPVLAVLPNFLGQNPHPKIPTLEPGFIPNYQVEVEFAIAVSPFTWKPGDWEDYAPSCLPDFDQKQDDWKEPVFDTWSYCGPVAVANSLWWYDSKFEPNPEPPPTINDHYSLVEAHGSYDDHSTSNVAPLVEELATYMQTDSSAPGTIITDVVAGTRQYIEDQDLAAYYTVSQVQKPEWDWLVDEVTRCEDVVLLLGFWKFDIDLGVWHRYGGHYVTVAGVDSAADLVGLSDPYLDQAEKGWPWLGRVYAPEGHQHPAQVPDTVHNDAGLLSHDVYHVVASPSPGGIWGLKEYPATAITNFEGLNGPVEDVIELPPPDPTLFYTEIEWAMAVSPGLKAYVPLTMKRF
jgi:hypothetical protein